MPSGGWQSFGRLSCATVVEPLRRKWVTRGRPWGVIVQPPFLSVLCYVTTDAVWPTSAVTPFPQQGTRISLARHLVIGRKGTTVLSLPHPSSARCISNIWPLGSTPQGSSLNNEDMQHVLEGLTSEQLGHQCGLKKKIRFLKNILFLYVWLHVCMCMPGVLRGQERVLGVLDLGLEIVVSHLMSVRNQTCVPHKSNKCS